MTLFLKVIGEKISPVDHTQYYPKKTSRKIFYTDLGKVDEYQHEIGNHFRDYKNRKYFHRHFKRRRHHQRVIFEEQPFVFRDELPLSRLNFPETNCDNYHQLFNKCYATTLRKISSSNSLNELQFLTKRQERLFKHKKVPRLSQGQFNLISTTKARFIKENENRILGQINSLQTKNDCETHKTNFNKAISEGVSREKCTQEKDFSNDIENCFFRLASECYDEGFLSHIKYLKSIVDHNAIKNTTTIKRTIQTYETENTKSNSQSSSVVSDVSSNNSVEYLTNNSVTEGRFASTVRRLLRNRQLNINNNPCNNDQRDLKICVNITRSTSSESLKSNRDSGFKPPANDSTANRCIMSDYLNSADTVSREFVDTHTGSTIKRQHFHDLIENLNKLEISDSRLLPKITISLADDNTKTPLTSTEGSERTIRKQDSLEVGLPFSNDYYNCEARPPIKTKLRNTIKRLLNMVTVEHLHQNSSASPPHEQNTTAEMSGNQGAAQQEVSEVEIGRIESAKVNKEALKSAVSQRSIDLKITKKPTTNSITKKVLKLDLASTKSVDEPDVMSPKSPVAGVRLSHQTSLTSSVDVEDRKTLREALYQGIFHRHRRTIFAVGSFLRMLRSRNSQYNTIRSSSEGEDINETR